MIILITGASHTVKTLLSQKLLEKYKYPYMSIDHLKMGLIRRGNTQLVPLNDDSSLTGVKVLGKEYDIIYDKNGEKYGLGKGFAVNEI